MSLPNEPDLLRQMALDHLWMHSADWVQMARDGQPLVIVEGHGVRVKDAEGNWWIDVNGGYASVHVGYGREEIADAAYRQMRQIHYFPARTTTPPTVRLAAKLAEITPGSLSRAFLVSGGSEANETALKIARAYHRRRGEPGRYRIISRQGSYHGGTGGVVWLGALPNSTRADLEPEPPGMAYAPQPNSYRCPFGTDNPRDCAVRCAEEIESLFQFYGPETVAAVIAEPIAYPPGAAVPGDEYWPAVREICDKHGVLLVVDEIITGFGRTGKMFALEHWGVVPDIMTVAKGISSCYLPLGAVIARKEIADLFAGEDNLLRHVFTFAGHPVAAAVGLKNIEIIEREGLVRRAAESGGLFKTRLQELQAKHSMIGDVRGLGLMLAMEMVVDRDTRAPFAPEAKVAEKLTSAFNKRGLLLRAEGHALVHLTPPLCVTNDEIDEIVTAIDESLTDVEQQLATSSSRG